jgi:Zn-dependent peptidase ImmA (M78 family)
VIALLQGKTAYREVFTAGEELAHLTMHSPLKVTAADADKEAHLFAQEFLLPAEAMYEEMQQPVTISSLALMKERWGVSIAFLAKRAQSLSLVTNNQYRYLIQQMHSLWGGKSEPGDENATPERPRLIRKMASCFTLEIRSIFQGCLRIPVYRRICSATSLIWNAVKCWSSK